MRKDFCSFLLSICPCLRVYGNISYNLHFNNNMSSSIERSDGSGLASVPSADSKQVITRQPKKQTIPHVSIESPDWPQDRPQDWPQATDQTRVQTCVRVVCVANNAIEWNYFVKRVDLDYVWFAFNFTRLLFIVIICNISSKYFLIH